ncbi:hypothetical protein SH528x_003526 [Novipirellula sp. SH528]|uniref:hypothetical protein n=1 Tax=Novipirellula sp. SH528 TaxID=3454466 RepID=UPI003FA0F822
MITCTNCNIAFSPGFATCPRCKTFETPVSDRKRYLTQDAKNRISDGQPAADVRAHLVANGFSDADADALVGDAASGLRSETRGHGLRRFVVGLLMLMLAGLFLAVLQSGARVRGSGFAIGFMIVAGGGLLATLSGLYTMLSGRESKFVGKIVDQTDRFSS